MKLPPPKEIVLHIQVATFLKNYHAEDWEFTHVPSGEHRDKRTAAKLKAMGTMPNWPDFILVSPEGTFHGLELKRKGESLNPGQRAWHSRTIGRGWKVTHTDSFDEALAILRDWGALRVNVGAPV
jgi:hypothetical protein